MSRHHIDIFKPIKQPLFEGSIRSINRLVMDLRSAHEDGTGVPRTLSQLRSLSKAIVNDFANAKKTDETAYRWQYERKHDYLAQVTPLLFEKLEIALLAWQPVPFKFSDYQTLEAISKGLSDFYTTKKLVHR